jgi:uncharacterized membrane protein YdbT with pleckstrin-like domain
LRLWLWAGKQVLAALGFLFTLAVVHYLLTTGAESFEQRMHAKGRGKTAAFWAHAGNYVWLLTVAEGFGFVFFLVQVPVSYALIRLEYEQRWYLITDRSLRLRHGLWNVREMTVSFANIQQTTLRQGPLERMLGLADLVVTTAGGGSVTHGPDGPAPTLFHTGVLRAVENAEEIRDLIQERLRQLKGSGLGDHDEPGSGSGVESEPRAAGLSLEEPSTGHARGDRVGVVLAAREVLDEVGKLRRTWQKSCPDSRSDG